MTMIKIHIVEENGNTEVYPKDGMPYNEVELTDFTVMEKATAQGDTGVVLAFTHEGVRCVATVTGNIFRSLSGAFTGADDRFKRNRFKKNEPETGEWEDEQG